MMNEVLRKYATQTRFTMLLSESMIQALVEIEEEHRLNRRIAVYGGQWRAAGTEGLVRRGLIEKNEITNPLWRLTKAGRLVRDLLKEAGIWDGYVKALWKNENIMLRKRGRGYTGRWTGEQVLRKHIKGGQYIRTSA